MSEVTVSAKDKKKDMTDRYKRSQNRSVPEKEKEDIEEAIKSLKRQKGRKPRKRRGNRKS
jgi:hypothetical protein